MPVLVQKYGISDTPLAVSDYNLTEPARGWDTAQQTFLVLGNHVDRNAILDAHWARGSGHPVDTSMFVVDRKTKDLGGGDLEIQVSWKGTAGNRVIFQESKIFGETSTGQDISSGLAGYPSFMSKLKIEQPVLSVETEYFQSTTPDLQEVKKPIVIPPTYGLPTPPVQIWTSITDPTYVYPAGWILDDRNVDPIPGASFYRITDRHVFRFQQEM